MTLQDAEDPKSKRKSVVGHFRVRKDLYDSLEAEAWRSKVSLNTLVNQVLSTHVSDDVIWEEMGSVRMTKIAYREVLKRVPDDKLEALGSVFAKETPSSIMLARQGEVDLEAVLDYLRFRSRAGWFSLSELKRNGRTSLSFIHDFGPRESIVLRSYFVSLFGLVGIRPKVITTDSSVVVEY